MSNLRDYFSTEWSAMTPTDWVGLLTSVVAFLVMVGLYVWVFNPKNKKTFESQRHIPMDSDDFDSEEKQ